MAENKPSVFDIDGLIKSLSDEAEATSRQNGIANTKTETAKNAYFHGYVSALLAYDYGDTLATVYGNLREAKTAASDLKKTCRRGNHARPI